MDSTNLTRDRSPSRFLLDGDHSGNIVTSATSTKSSDEKQTEQIALGDLQNRSISELLSNLQPSANADELERIFNHGNQQEQNDACMDLFHICRNDDLPDSIRSVSKVVLLKFLEKVVTVESLPFFIQHNDPDKMFVLYLRKFLLSLIPLNSLPKSSPESEQDIVHIYGYLKKLDAKIDDVLLNDAIGCVVKQQDHKAKRICELLCDHVEFDSQKLAVDLISKLNYAESAGAHDPDSVLAVLTPFMDMAARKPLSCAAAACWLANFFGSPIEKVIYYSRAAVKGDKHAIDKLNEFAARHHELENIKPLEPIWS